MPLQTQSGGGALAPSTLATINALAAGIFPTQGNIININPRTGNDNNPGTSASPLASLEAALYMATAGQNDIVFLQAAGNAAGATTVRPNGQLDWNKDLVHLVGVNGGPFLGQRSRIAFQAAYAGATNLFKLSANGCLIKGIEFYEGVASALPTGCMEVTGQRNHIVGCQISGMGAAANDIAGAYSLYLNAGAENYFEDCYIGLDTVTLGAAANSQIKCASQATRNKFRECRIATYTNHATNNNFLRCPTGSLDRWIEFEDCIFINPVDAASTALTQAMIVASDAGGSVLITGAKTGLIGATDWNSTDSGNVRAINGSVTNNTFGLGIPVTR